MAQFRHDLKDLRRSGERLAKRIVGGNEARFLKSWLDKPLATGAVSPSGKALCRMMASYVDPETPGPVIELGPGTGVVTEALIARGVDESRLVLVEFNPAFCAMLKARYPRATVIEGDAYGLGVTLQGKLKKPAAAIVSSLPLMTRPEFQRLSLLREAFRLAAPGAPFIQFTYATVSPMPKTVGGFSAHASPRVWLNLPPAQVWVYRSVQG
jgi:phosphatidylethanolamine/phosphatidyl-N-methylethanolamine N-methyltransferase